MSTPVAVASSLIREATALEAKQELHEAVAKLEQVRFKPSLELHSPVWACFPSRCDSARD